MTTIKSNLLYRIAVRYNCYIDALKRLLRVMILRTRYDDDDSAHYNYEL